LNAAPMQSAGRQTMPVHAYANPAPNRAGGVSGGRSIGAVAVDRSYNAPIMAFNTTGLNGGQLAYGVAGGRGQVGGSQMPAYAPTPFVQTADGQPVAAKVDNELDKARAHNAIEVARAELVHNRSYLLTAGTVLPCILQTAINSTQVGYVSCIVPHDVWSEDGRIVLLEKGTKVLGQYTGGIQQGQSRMFILWTRALTPRGVAIDLGSPASDQLGRAGVDGGIETFFWQRFGAALMLSVIEDIGQAASQHFAGAGSNTTQVPSSVANTALQGTINIRPVLKKNQGDEVGIFVAKDFDFRNVYSVSLRK